MSQEEWEQGGNLSVSCHDDLMENGSGLKCRVAGVMLCVLVGTQAIKYLGYLPESRWWALFWVFLCLALIGILPFLLARTMPRIAGFEVRWLPLRLMHWLWFVGMVVLLFLASAFWQLLLSFGESEDLLESLLTPFVDTTVSPMFVVFKGIALILVGPLAEEIFWRGYLLTQLRRLMNGKLALVVQALLFAVAHLPTPWTSLPILFFYGVVFGLWRIRFRSLLPLVLAHIIINAAALLPYYVIQYHGAIETHPKYLEIQRLGTLPVEEALPRLMKFLDDEDEVAYYAVVEEIRKHYYQEASPYLEEALKSNNPRVVERALFVAGLFGYSELKEPVRRVVWSSKEPTAGRAAMTLGDFRDEEGLQEIAEKHPDATVRRMARGMLKIFQEEKEKEKVSEQ